MYRYVRIYEPARLLERPATLVTTSMSVCVDPEVWQQRLGATYTVRELSRNSERDRKIVERLGEVVPWHCFEIQPPLNDESIKTFVAICTETAETGKEAGFLVDHRKHQPPFVSYDQRGTILARWSLEYS